MTDKDDANSIIQSSEITEFYSAIDLGTNNCRILVAKPHNCGFSVVSSFSKIVRLGEGVEKQNLLSKKAMDRTISALSMCAQKMHNFNIISSRNVATEACRKSSNSKEFFERVQEETGLIFEIINSQEEARLAVLGCQNLLDERKKFGIIIDIGGGSTEIIWVKNNKGNCKIIDYLSLPFGVVNLSESYRDSGANKSLYINIIGQIRDELDSFCKLNQIRRNIDDQQVQMLGTSGTVTTLAAINLNLLNYRRDLIDGIKLTFDQINRSTIKLNRASYAERCTMPCIGEERAELIIPGCGILEAICSKWPVGRLRVADRGLREGIILELMFKNGIKMTGNPALNN
ncbi:MAG: Ppx/GppA family phosphatase [Rhodospirillales bacterium]|tara:strand:- start:38992 stop:40023 length:1032 start_codon:yes stop_codon:yes gene_type:complete